MNRQLAGHVGIMEWTVANRIRRMQDAGSCVWLPWRIRESVDSNTL